MPYLFYFSLIVKQDFVCLYKSHSNLFLEPTSTKQLEFLAQGKQQGPLMGLELTTDGYPPITSQTRYPLRLASLPYNRLNSVLNLCQNEYRWVKLKAKGF